jgi:hypothetical protein
MIIKNYFNGKHAEEISRGPEESQGYHEKH